MIASSLTLWGALLAVGYGHYSRAHDGRRPPYSDAFLILTTLRGRSWPAEHSLPTVGLNVLLAASFFMALHDGRLYFVGEREGYLLFYAILDALATIALIVRQPWSWWLLQACLLAVVLFVALNYFPHLSLTTQAAIGIISNSLQLLYVRRRRFAFSATAELAVATPPN